MIFFFFFKECNKGSEQQLHSSGQVEFADQIYHCPVIIQCQKSFQKHISWWFEGIG